MDQSGGASSPPKSYLTIARQLSLASERGRRRDLFAARCGWRSGWGGGVAVVLIAGVIAALQGYSFAKLGARYPTAGGLLEYVAKGFGDGHFTGITAWLTYERTPS